MQLKQSLDYFSLHIPAQPPAPRTWIFCCVSSLDYERCLACPHPHRGQTHQAGPRSLECGTPRPLHQAGTQENRNIFCLDRCNKLISHLAELRPGLRQAGPSISAGNAASRGQQRQELPQAPASPAPTAHFQPHGARNSTPRMILACGGWENLG